MAAAKHETEEAESKQEAKRRLKAQNTAIVNHFLH